MSTDYMPANDQQVVAWLTNFMSVLTVHAADLGVSAGELTALGTAKSDFSTKLIAHVSQQAAARAATQDKIDARSAMTAVVRPLVREICANPNMTDGLREALGLRALDEVKTPNNLPGSEVPRLELESLTGQVIVHFGTNPQNERVNSRPSWATGCVIYRRKSGEQDFRMVGYQKTSPMVDIITGPAADYSYMARYQGKKATDLGPESPEQTIAARGLQAA